MQYIDEYRDKGLANLLLEKISSITTKEIILMEVCGGHTWAIQKFGIPSLLPDNIKLLSGPGCPVCVTSKKYIDQAIAYSRLKDVIITTYGTAGMKFAACRKMQRVRDSAGNRLETLG